MRYAFFALSAAVVAALFAPLAFAGDNVVSAVSRIDAKAHSLILADRTVMMIDRSVDLSGIAVGDTVRVTAPLDEDGYGAAASVEILR